MRYLKMCVGAALVAGCATNPVTGKSQLSFISESQAIEMGRQQLAASAQDPGFYDDPALQKYVTRIGLSMARNSERPDLPWEFHVIDDPAVNAFAAPGGFIFVTRGIITYLNSEAQLAEVLGHEIGHVTAKHAVTMMSQQTLTQGLLGLGAVLKPDLASGLLGQAANVAATLYFLQYSRDDEKMADKLGFRYSTAAGYDPRQMPETYKTLERLASASGSRKLPGFLSTHPDPGDRVDYTTAWADTVANAARLKVGRDVYLDHVDGVVFGPDPQQGYFANGEFVHPALHFRFAVPDGWHGTNHATQVVIAAPDGSAEVSVQFAPEATPQAAAQAFFGQNGVQGGGVRTGSVNGLPAAGGAFTATASNGASLRGSVLFVGKDGKVFRVMGLSLAAAWAQNAGTLDQVINSFGPTAPGQQFRQRRYINVVKLPRATSVAALAARNGNVATAAELAILNGVPDDATFAAGTEAKIVVTK